MKYIILFFLIFQCVCSAAQYRIDQSHSTVDFDVTHLVISKVRGNFNVFSGEIVWDQTNLKSSFFKGYADVSSIDTNHVKRDEHLVSPDFFDQKKYPKILFETVEITKDKQSNRYELIANLTLKGITKQISALLVVKGPITDNWGNKRMAFETSFNINRFDYNLNWNKLIETGELVVGEDVLIDIKIQGIEIK